MTSTSNTKLETSYELALSALRLAIADACSFPKIKHGSENRQLVQEALRLAKDVDQTSIVDQNRTRVILVLNRAVTRYLSSQIPAPTDLQSDLDTLLRAVERDGLPHSTPSLSLDILSFFSEVARKYCIENPADVQGLDERSDLRELRAICVANAEKLVRRSLLQKTASERTLAEANDQA